MSGILDDLTNKWKVIDWAIEGAAALIIILIFGNGLGWLPIRIAVSIGGTMTLPAILQLLVFVVVFGLIMEKIQKINISGHAPPGE